MSRVLVVSFAVVPAPNDQGVYVDSLVSALGTRYEVDAMTMRGGDLPHVQSYRRARMLRVPVAESAKDSTSTKEHVRVFKRAVQRQLEGNDYDVIHACDADAGMIVREARGHHAKVVYDLNGRVACSGIPKRDRAKTERLCLANADLVVAHSMVARDEITARFPNVRSVLVGPGVDVDLFDWEQIPMPRVPRLVYHGAVAPGCGVRLLIAAFARVLFLQRALLWIIGAGEQAFFDELNALASDLGVGEHVEFFGAVAHSQLPRILAVGTLGLVPAVRGGAACPRKVLEHAACKKAIVAVRHPVIGETLAEGVEFAAFEPGDEHQLADEILRLLSVAEARERMAAAAYRRVREERAASAARRALLSAYLPLAPPLPLPKGSPAADTAEQTRKVIVSGTADGLATIPNLPILPVEPER